MYLKQFHLDGIKCFSSVDVEFPHRGEDYSGWIVILGGNGTGKTTLLQAMALTLVGPLAGQRLLHPEGWVRAGQGSGRITAELLRGTQDQQAGAGAPRKKPFAVQLAITGREFVELNDQPYDQPQIVHLDEPRTRKALANGPYAARQAGWFSCGYGPFRRLSGGDSSVAQLIYAPGREARFATLFKESAALTRCQDWLMQMYSQSVDPANREATRTGENLALVKKMIDSLLPGGVAIEKIDTTSVYFRTIGGTVVPAPDLSDGYRSFLSLVIDLLRHVLDSHPDLSLVVQSTEESPQVLVEGVVLIDEVDVHLHPVWQRTIGFKLRQIFPRMQFIVTTHSPFVAQAGSEGGLLVLKSENGQVVAVQPQPSVQGWRVDEILTSPLFGLQGTRDLDTESLLLAQQRFVAQRQWHQLAPQEQRELREIEEILASRLTAPGESPSERQRYQRMAEYVEKTLENLGDRP